MNYPTAGGASAGAGAGSDVGMTSGGGGPGDRLRRPHPDRLDPRRADYEAVLAAHDRALEAGEAGYLDPSTGLFVLTAAALVARGACCGQGCRHCPYLPRG